MAKDGVYGCGRAVPSRRGCNGVRRAECYAWRMAIVLVLLELCREYEIMLGRGWRKGGRMVEEREWWWWRERKVMGAGYFTSLFEMLPTRSHRALRAEQSTEQPRSALSYAKPEGDMATRDTSPHR